MAAHICNFSHRQFNAFLGFHGHCMAMAHRHAGRENIHTYKFIWQKQRSHKNKKKARRAAVKAESHKRGAGRPEGGWPLCPLLLCPLLTHLQAARSAIPSLLLNSLLEMSTPHVSPDLSSENQTDSAYPSQAGVSGCGLVPDWCHSLESESMETWIPSLPLVLAAMELPLKQHCPCKWLPSHLTALPWLISASSGKTCTLGIIKPDAVAHGKAEEIIMKVGGA